MGGVFWISLLLSLTWIAFTLDFLAPAFESDTARPVAAVLLIAGIIAIFGFFYWRRGRWGRMAVIEYEARLQAWSRQWCCLRCNHAGDQEDFEGAVQRRARLPD